MLRRAFPAREQHYRNPPVLSPSRFRVFIGYLFNENKSINCIKTLTGAVHRNPSSNPCLSVPSQFMQPETKGPCCNYGALGSQVSFRRKTPNSSSEREVWRYGRSRWVRNTDWWRRDVRCGMMVTIEYVWAPGINL